MPTKLAGTPRVKRIPAGSGQQVCLSLWLLPVVRCKPVGVEQDGHARMMVTCCAVDATSINVDMVRSGYALAYREFSQEYVAEEKMARAEGPGLHGSTFVAPWDCGTANGYSRVAHLPSSSSALWLAIS